MTDLNHQPFARQDVTLIETPLSHMFVTRKFFSTIIFILQFYLFCIIYLIEINNLKYLIKTKN